MVAALARASLDGAYPQSGPILARKQQVVRLSGADTTGWTSAKWTITSYPEEWAPPFDGWTYDSATGYYASTAITPPEFRLATTTWGGKWDVDLLVNGILSDSSLRIEVLHPLGLRETVFPGRFARDGFRDFARDVNRNWRRLILAIQAGDGPVTSVASEDETMPTERIQGRVTAGTGPVENLTGAQATTLLSIFTDFLKGLVPPSGGGTTTFLRADGSWVTPPGAGIGPNDVTDGHLRDSAGNSVIGRSAATAGDPADIVAGSNDTFLGRIGNVVGFFRVTLAGIADIAQDRILGRVSAGTGVIEQLTGTQVTALLNLFTSSLKGLVPASGGGTANFLRADGTWISPPGAGIGPNDVTDSHLRDSAACSVMGRAANSIGDPADIVSSADGEVLRRAAGALAWGTIATAGIGDAQVTDPKLRNSTACSVIGRSAGTGGVPGDIAAVSDGQVFRRAAGVLAFGTISTAGIGDGQVTDPKLRDSAACSVIGRSVNTAGVPADIAAATNDRVFARSANALAFVQVTSAMIGNNQVGDPQLRTGGACSVVGRSGNTVGNLADISASTNDRVFCRTGDALVFAQITGAMVADGTLPYAKLQNVTASRLHGRGSASSGPTEELTATGGVTIVGTNLQREAITGDVNVPAGSNASTFRSAAATSVIGRSAGTAGVPADIAASTDGFVLRRAAGVIGFGTIAANQTIQNNTVTMAELADLAGLSVIGRSANTTGDPAAITAAADFQVLRRLGTTLSFGTVAAGGIGDAEVTDPKLRDSAAVSVIGRSAATAGVPADIVATGDGLILRRAGGVLAFGTIAGNASIQNNTVTFAEIQDIAGLSVVGRSANTTGDPGAITAVTDGHVLRLSGTTLGFGTIATAGIGDAQVTDPKLRNSVATSVIGRSAGTAGAPGDIAASTDGFLLRRAAGALGFGTIAGNASIQNNTVTTTELQQLAGVSVLGRAGATTGNMAAITSGTDGFVLRQAAGSVGFGTIAGNASIQNNTVTTSELQQLAGVSVLGRSPNSTGNMAAISAGFDNAALVRTSGALSFAKLPVAAIENVADASLIGRALGAGSGPPSALTAASIKAIIRDIFPEAIYSIANGNRLSGQPIPFSVLQADSNYSLSGVPTNQIQVATTGEYEVSFVMGVSFPDVGPEVDTTWQVQIFSGVTLAGLFFGRHFDSYPTDKLTISGFDTVTIATAGSTTALSILVIHPFGPSANVFISSSALFKIRKK